jgi:hypothetical protein
MCTGGQNKGSVSGPGSLDGIKTVSAGEGGKTEVLRQAVRWLDTRTRQHTIKDGVSMRLEGPRHHTAEGGGVG